MPDFHSLPSLLIRMVRKLVQADISTYNEIDLRTKELQAVNDYVGNAEKHFPAFMAHVHEQPVLSHIVATGSTAVLKTSDFMSQQDFKRTGIYNEYFRHLGSRYHIAFFLPRSLGFEVGIALQRSTKDFNENDRSILSLFAPHFRLAW